MLLNTGPDTLPGYPIYMPGNEQLCAAVRIYSFIRGRRVGITDLMMPCVIIIREEKTAKLCNSKIIATTSFDQWSSSHFI
jgi:hypothetical protein